MIEPQLSGRSLAGAEDLTNLTVREAVLLCFKQQLFRHAVSVDGGNARHQVFLYDCPDSTLNTTKAWYLLVKFADPQDIHI